MFKMYDKDCLDYLKVKECYFRRIFNENFNIGFGSPRTDVCSYCLSSKNKIKYEADSERRQQLISEYRIHRLRASAFFDKLRESRGDLLTLCFDCQKNQLLPKVPDQAAYYSRKLYIYNFAIVQGCSTTPLRHNTMVYTWSENERAKGSNEISSAVYNKLNTVSTENIKTIRLVADGCPGQNKNTTMVGICCKWLFHAPKNVKDLEIIFPVVGHSFIPPDRVFGLIETEIKRKETIIEPTEYETMFSKYGSLVKLGEDDCPVFDWKNAIEQTLKPCSSWHFKIKSCKRIFITRTSGNKIIVKGELNYRTDVGKFGSLLRKSETLNGLKPIVSQTKPNLNPLKLRDVNTLLVKHFGENWRDLQHLNFYKEVIDEQRESTGSYSNDEYCERNFESENLQHV